MEEDLQLNSQLESQINELQNKLKKSLNLNGHIYDGEYIGGGADAHVYLVHENNTGEKIAVKRFLLESKDEFDNEVRYLNMFRDSNFIVQIYSSYEDDKYAYITMELCETSVSKYLRKLEKDNTPIDTFLAKRIIHNMFAGLDIIHEHNIIHGDIKPGNLLFANNTVKIIDFCTAIHEDEVTPKLFGTFLYTAPEILIVSPYNTRADIWSAAISAFEIVTGHILFDAYNENDFEYGEELSYVSADSDYSEDSGDSKTDSLKMDSLKTNSLETDESETNESETNESETNESETNESETDDKETISEEFSMDEDDMDEEKKYRVIYRLLLLQEKMLGQPNNNFTTWGPLYYNSEGRLKNSLDMVYFDLNNFVNANYNDLTLTKYLTFDFMKIMHQCLQFDYMERPSANQVLKSHYFDYLFDF